MLTPLTIPWLVDEGEPDHFYLVPGDITAFLAEFDEFGTSTQLDDHQLNKGVTVEYEGRIYTIVFGRIEGALALAKHLDLAQFFSYNTGSLFRFEKEKNYKYEMLGEVELLNKNPSGG